jgi:hypothetical protein
MTIPERVIHPLRDGIATQYKEVSHVCLWRTGIKACHHMESFSALWPLNEEWSSSLWRISSDLSRMNSTAVFSRDFVFISLFMVDMSLVQYPLLHLILTSPRN